MPSLLHDFSGSLTVFHSTESLLHCYGADKDKIKVPKIYQVPCNWRKREVPMETNKRARVMWRGLKSIQYSY